MRRDHRRRNWTLLKSQRKNVWLMSVPVGLVTTGILISSASIQQSGVIYYGYMASPAKYSIFFGTIMFYGTAAPELFAAVRGRLKNSIDS